MAESSNEAERDARRQRIVRWTVIAAWAAKVRPPASPPVA